MVGAFDFEEFGVVGMGAVDDVGDGEAVGAAHDGVGGAVKDENGCGNILPDFS